ncbi:MAG: hypothetical protein NVSMB65_11740 [Chloroflexota bacterium]
MTTPGPGAAAAAGDKRVAVKDVVALEAEMRAFDLAAAPRSTTFAAHDLYLLEQGGYSIVQVVFGNIVYSMGVKGLLRTVGRALRRGEMTDFTRMLNDAREIARNRMLGRAQELGATAVVGVTFETQEFADFLEVTARGTAVVKKGDQPSTPLAVAVGA